MNDVFSLVADSFTKILLPGLLLTLPLTIVSYFLSLCIGTLTAVIQYRKIPVLYQLGRFYIWIMRGTPLLIQLYIIFFGLPSIGIVLDPIPAAILVFSFNEGAYTAETMRGALNAIPVAQVETGEALGLSFFQILKRIMLPQAFRIAFPSLSNSLICMVKDMSLTANIAVAEMFYTTQRIVARTYEALALYIELAIIYLLFCTVLTFLQRKIEKRIQRTWKVQG